MEREAAARLMANVPRRQRATVGADRAYDTHGFVAAMREQGVTPHVAQHTKGRRSAIDGRTTDQPGYRVSQIMRKPVEHPFAWAKAGGRAVAGEVSGPDEGGLDVDLRDGRLQLDPNAEPAERRVVKRLPGRVSRIADWSKGPAKSLAHLDSSLLYADEVSFGRHFSAAC
jgi:hypothetical protein